MFKKSILFTFILSTCLFANMQQNLEKAVEEYNNENFRSAIQSAKLVLEEDPNNVMANYIVGLIFYGTNNIPYAIKYLEIANKSANAPEGTAQTLHAAYIYGGLANKALPFFAKEIEIKPNDEFTMLHYGMSLQYTGDYTNAIKVYKTLLKQGTTNDMVMFNVGKMFVERKQYLDAKDMFSGINATSAYFTQSQAYLDQVEYLLRPIRTYASFKYLNNSNPNSTSSKGTDAIKSSVSLESILMLSSRDINVSDKLTYTPQYLLYHINHSKKHSQGNDYYSHMTTPVRLNYTFDNKVSIFTDLKANFNYLDYGKYSKQYGIQVGVNRVSQNGKVYSASLDVEKSSHTNNSDIYNDAIKYDLKLNANELIKNDYNIQLGLSYTYTINDTLENGNSDSTIANQAKDSEYTAHAISTDIMAPLSGAFEKFSFLINASYTATEYSNTQTGELYTDMLNKTLETDYYDSGLILRYSLSSKYNANLDFGSQYIKSESNEDSLNYKNKKYFVGISYYY